MLSQDPLDRLKRRLRVMRTSRGLSMAGLELRAGLGHTTVGQALNGPSVPSEQTVVALAEALRIPAEPLLALRAEACPSVQRAVDGAAPGTGGPALAVSRRRPVASPGRRGNGGAVSRASA